MATRPRPVKHTMGGATDRFAVWGDPAKVKTFFPDLTPATAADPVDRTMSVKAHTRQQYPGDPTPVNRGGGTRTVLIGGSSTSKTTPGYPFTCEVTTGTGASKVTKVTQFTLVGPFSWLKEMALLDATTGAGPAKWVLRSPGGKGYEIERSGTQGAPAATGGTP